MSISGISNSSYNPYPLGSASNPLQQQFQQLGQALQSGNLSVAQSDFAALQHAVSQTGSTAATSNASTSTGATNPITQAFNQVASDLQSGNISAAQKDYATLQQDIQSQEGTNSSGHRWHNHHHMSSGGGSGDAASGSGTSTGTSSIQNSLLQDLNQIGQSLSSSNLAGAQQAYSTLQQQLEQFALGGTLSSSQSSVLLSEPSLSLVA